MSLFRSLTALFGICFYTVCMPYTCKCTEITYYIPIYTYTCTQITYTCIRVLLIEKRRLFK